MASIKQRGGAIVIGIIDSGIISSCVIALARKAAISSWRHLFRHDAASNDGTSVAAASISGVAAAINA